MVKELTNAEFSAKMKSLKGEVKHLKCIVCTMIDDMQALSIRDGHGNRTEFSAELQEQIDSWKEEMERI